MTDTAGVDDQSFNASAWQGVQDAIEAGYATEDSTFLESDSPEDWQPNIDTFLSQDCEHIVTVGFLLGEVTDSNAAANPDVNWTMVDNVLDNQYDNLVQNVYQTDEAAFLAGYLAAGVSKTGTIGTYGGQNIPTVSIFMDGYPGGAFYYNVVLAAVCSRRELIGGGPGVSGVHHRRHHPAASEVTCNSSFGGSPNGSRV
mgnify:CR=1 FL=1